MHYSNKQRTFPFVKAPYGDSIEVYVGDDVAIVKALPNTRTKKRIYLQIGSWDAVADELIIEDQYVNHVDGEALAATLRKIHVQDLEEARIKAENDYNEALWASDHKRATSR
jgi:hypothetical protein